MLIIDGARRFGKPGPGGSWVEADLEQVVCAPDSPHSRMAVMHGVKIPPITSETVDVKAPVTACLNHNRWIAHCPDCSGAEFVFFAKPYLWCAQCMNAQIGHRWRTIIIPTPGLRRDIERIVKARPIPDNRNWTVGENLDDMRRENREHGLMEEV